MSIRTKAIVGVVLVACVLTQVVCLFNVESFEVVVEEDPEHSASRVAKVISMLLFVGLNLGILVGGLAGIGFLVFRWVKSRRENQKR